VPDDSATAAHNRNGGGKHARPIETRPGILQEGKTDFLSFSPTPPSVKRGNGSPTSCCPVTAMETKPPHNAILEK